MVSLDDTSALSTHRYGREKSGKGVAGTGVPGIAWQGALRLVE
jgi:hypothetical protein